METCTDENHSKSYPGGFTFNKTASINKSLIQRSLLTPNEIRIFPKDEGIAIINGEPAVLFKRIIYYQDKRFRDRIIPCIQIHQVNPKYLLTQKSSFSNSKNEMPSLMKHHGHVFDTDLLDEILID